MKVAAVRMVADWLSGANGVNAKLALVPLDAGDTAPAGITVFDETRDADTALARIKDRAGRPSVQVQSAALTSQLLNSAQQGNPVGDFELTIGIRVARSDDESEKGTRDLAYTEDAVITALRHFHRDDQIAARTRAGVVLEYAKDLATVLAVAPDRAELVTSFITVTYQARYTFP